VENVQTEKEREKERKWKKRSYKGNIKDETLKSEGK
jgi:hypothetical protein